MKKSAKAVLILVYPDLKSSPAIKTSCFLANSITPGTKVFYGDPLIKVTPSKIEATAYTVDGEISASLFSIAFITFSILSWIPAYNLQNLSVLAVHKIKTFSSLLVFLKFLISSLI